MQRRAQANKAMYNELVGSRDMAGGGLKKRDWNTDARSRKKLWGRIQNVEKGVGSIGVDLTRHRGTPDRSALTRSPTTRPYGPTYVLGETTFRLPEHEHGNPHEHKASVGSVRLYVVTAHDRADDADEDKRKDEDKYERKDEDKDEHNDGRTQQYQPHVPRHRGTTSAMEARAGVPELTYELMTPQNKLTKPQSDDEARKVSEYKKLDDKGKKKKNREVRESHVAAYGSSPPQHLPVTVRIDVAETLGRIGRLPSRTNAIKVKLYNGTADQAVTDSLGKDIYVLNLANASKPCGGYKTGEIAQEESLCRSSHALSVSLENAKFANYYDGWGDANWDKTVLFTPNVPFNYHDDTRAFAERDPPVDVNVITAAFPHIESWKRKSKHSWRDDVNKKKHDNVLEIICRIPEIMKNKKTNKRVLILGAIGCGVYAPGQPDLKTMYRGFVAERIKTFFNLFETDDIWDEVLIAITGSTKDSNTIVSIFDAKFRTPITDAREYVWNSASIPIRSA